MHQADKGQGKAVDGKWKNCQEAAAATLAVHIRWMPL
jgi:hypothetical protein